MKAERYSISSRNASQGAQNQGRGHIFCLPAEALIEAFAYLLPETLAIDDGFGEPKLRPDWYLGNRRQHNDLIRITHVCSSWRRICLSVPSFWSLLWVTDEERFESRTKAFVERSGNGPLEIAARDECIRIQRYHLFRREDEDSFDGHHFLSDFFNEYPHMFHRMKTLRISLRIPPGQDFTKCFEREAPLLESLALYHDDNITAPFQLPSPLFNGCSPSLKKLSLNFVDVPWTSPIFNNLTFLRVSKEIDTPDSECVELDVLLKIIESCPGLVSLELDFAGPVWPASRTATGAGAVVDVTPALRALSLRNISLLGMTEMALVHAFLSHLQTPGLRILNVGHFGLSFRSIDEFLPQTLSFDPRTDLCNCIKMDVDPKREVVLMDQFRVDDLEIKMLEDPQYFSLRWLRQTKSTFRWRIRVNNDDEGDFGPDGDMGADEYKMIAISFLRKMCASPEHIRAIEVRGSDNAIMEFPFRAVLKYLTNVYCIEIRYNLGYIRAAWFMAFLHAEAAAHMKEDTPGVALRSVHMLIFDSVEFTPGSFKALFYFLHHRKDREAPLSYLGINYCKGVGEKRLATLKGLVTSVYMVNDTILAKYGDEMPVDLPGPGRNSPED